MPRAGFAQTIKIGGGVVALTGITVAAAGGQVYQLNAVYNTMLPGAATVIYDNAVVVSAADIESINYLRGTITFRAGYVVTGPVTADFSRQAMHEFVGIHAHSFEENIAKLIKTTYSPGAASAAEDSFAGVKSLTASASSIEYLGDDLDQNGTERKIIDTLRSGATFVFEDSDEGLRSYVKFLTANSKSSADGRFEGEFTFVGVTEKDISFGYDASFDFA